MTKGAEAWRWFRDGRYGLFLHWGPYAVLGRGEQVLFREHLDQRSYADAACQWNPRRFDAARWAAAAVEGGFRYGVLTARHHDGYCLWETATTDYSSASQAPRRDLLREYVEAFRAAGLGVGLYYSLGDWRLPAFYEGPAVNPAGWTTVRDYLHAQVRELLTRYGRIDYLWFDGLWPRTSAELDGERLVAMIRALQPGILINNRLDEQGGTLGDVGTPEHRIVAERDRLWESCQVTTWRLWGYAEGERWRPAELWLDMLCQCAAMGGNLLLNVGPTAEGELPAEFLVRAKAVGDWLRVHGEAVYGEGAGDVTEFVSHGWQTVRDGRLYLIFRFWQGAPELRLPDLLTPVRRATLLATGQELTVRQEPDAVILGGLPACRPTTLFPVIRLEFDGPIAVTQWGRERLWGGDPQRLADWARQRGESVWTDGQSHPQQEPT